MRESWLAERLTAALGDPRLGVAAAARPRTFVVDYSAPNVAKPMHVGHIRSTVIGDALYRILKFAGHNVISDNHIGDWGTQFGRIIYGYKHFLDPAAYRQAPIDELARLYRLVSARVDRPDASDADDEAAAGHSEFAAAVLAETAKLHAGDPENLRLWREFLPVCLADIERIYRRLHVRFDHTLGESFYNDQLAAIVQELLDRRLARTSDGAVCVFLDGHKTPMIVRKQDGAFLYATTDLATIHYRMDHWRPDAILYVVDHRQGLHFQQLFAVARLLGYNQVELQHVSFGTVLGDDGRPFRTRAGDTVGLEGLLDEAVARAAAIVAANDDAKPDGAELSAAERARVAETVGIAALKYADLSQNRTSDYVFSYDKMLAMNGNTATYMQYSYARAQSIFARGKVDIAALRSAPRRSFWTRRPSGAGPGTAPLRRGAGPGPGRLSPQPTDRLPVRAGQPLLDVLRAVPRLAGGERRPARSRLLLCDLTARTIQQGLALLGIDVVEKM